MISKKKALNIIRIIIIWAGINLLAISELPISADLTSSVYGAAAPVDWNNTLARAKKEGKVMIYGQVGPELRVALTNAIKEQLGLDMELVPGKGREVITKFQKELQAGVPSADMLLGGSSTFLGETELYALWEKLEPLLMLPEVLDAKAWPKGIMPFLDSQKKLIPLVLEVNQFLLINTKMVKTGQIKSYRDLLQPQWKGKIVMFDPTVSGTGQTWVKFLLLNAYGEQEGETFLKKFVTQEPVLTTDSRLQIEWLARGRYPVIVAIDPQAGYQMQRSGAPITRVPAEEGSFLTGAGSHLVIPTRRPHPNASIVVLNWLLSPRGMEVFSKAYGAPAARLGIKIDDVSPMALPFPGEKLYLQTEDSVLFNKGVAVAKRIFSPLVK